MQNDAFYGTGTIALNDKLAFPLQQDINNDYEMSTLEDIELKKIEVCKYKFIVLF